MLAGMILLPSTAMGNAAAMQACVTSPNVQQGWQNAVDVAANAGLGTQLMQQYQIAAQMEEVNRKLDEMKRRLGDEGASNTSNFNTFWDALARSALDKMFARQNVEDDHLARAGKEGVLAAARVYNERILRGLDQEDRRQGGPMLRRQMQAPIEASYSWALAYQNQGRLAGQAGDGLANVFSMIQGSAMNTTEQWAANTALMMTLSKEMIAMILLAGQELTYDVALLGAGINQATMDLEWRRERR
jgi:hypothetical protein